jgi:2-succinyl-5-enolpyruvyl-6-hydroxy-3-cyclohexene-1-carboxylate synthase
MDSAKSLAHLHAMVVVEELCRCGIEVFCLSPGARAIPLVLALESQPAVVTKLFNDERSAAFWAQGAAKAGVLACLICTSGTAAANYLPAVAEAAFSGTPLLVLTTDRPFELQYAKANQTLPQRDLFAPFVQLVVDIPAPERQIFPHSLLGNLDQAVFEMCRTARPVHLNIAYRKPFVDDTFTNASLPLEEVATLTRWFIQDVPHCEYFPPQIGLAACDLQRLVDRIDTARHIVCVAGPLPITGATHAIPRLAKHLGAPLLADINSGLRCNGSHYPSLALYNLYLRNAIAQLPQTDLVLYFGDRIVSEPLREYLAVNNAEFLLCTAYPLRQDAIENEFIYPTMKVWGDPCALAESLLPLLAARQPTALTDILTTYEKAAQQHVGALLEDSEAHALHEGRIVYDIFQHTRDDGAIYLSASLIFREAEYFVPCLQKTLMIGTNRGATGIDGVLSSGIGFGEGLGKPCTILIGDQALLHDLNALSLLTNADVPVYVIVVNNHSGAIFHFFDLGTSNKRLHNPHQWDFCGVAENFRLAYTCPSSPQAFVAAYEEAQTQQRSTLFELIVDGGTSVRLFQAASTTDLPGLASEAT